MEKILVSAGSCFGAFWISYWARSLDTAIGYVCFAIGVIVFLASWISVIKDVIRDKKNKEGQ